MTPRAMQGDELQYIRREMAEMTLEHMARKLNISPADLAEMEAGRKEIPAHLWNIVFDIMDD